MAIIVSSSGTGIDYALYGDKSHVVAGYVQQQLQQMPVYASPYQERMQHSLQASYAYLTDSAIRNDIANQLRHVGVDLGENFIVELRSFEELQHANLTMQRWVMAEPSIRQMYLDQNLDGYSDTYINTSGKYVGERDYHYQLAMSGVPVDRPDGTSVVRFYHAEDELMPGDRALTHHEKIAIQRSWRNARDIARDMGFDFTNQSEVPSKINFE